MQRAAWPLSLRGALSRGARPPSILVWPEVPAPLYYDDGPHFRDYVDDLARATQTYLLLGVVRTRSRGAPLNSAHPGFARAAVRSAAMTKSTWCLSASSFPGRSTSSTSKVSSEAGDFTAGHAGGGVAGG